ncbi:hypothetical protein EVAR_11086_1 [Eumeta japonica]|uniref:Uncharacterized protein n=1 Tax=Eumeta variegata TaxID=151549 RepID=A0A4C1U3T9_EUMVA|nr:hypothetical protein EVAR_11086_1 [Eumeta japonica]
MDVEWRGVAWSGVEWRGVAVSAGGQAQRCRYLLDGLLLFHRFLFSLPVHKECANFELTDRHYPRPGIPQ